MRRTLPGPPWTVGGKFLHQGMSKILKSMEGLDCSWGLRLTSVTALFRDIIMLSVKWEPCPMMQRSGVMCLVNNRCSMLFTAEYGFQMLSTGGQPEANPRRMRQSPFSKVSLRGQEEDARYPSGPCFASGPHLQSTVAAAEVCSSPGAVGLSTHPAWKLPHAF